MALLYLNQAPTCLFQSFCSSCSMCLRQKYTVEKVQGKSISHPYSAFSVLYNELLDGFSAVSISLSLK